MLATRKNHVLLLSMEKPTMSQLFLINIQVPLINSGGRKIIAKFNNKDATKSFDRIGHSKEARDLLQTFLVNNSALQPNASKIAINKPLNLKEDYQYQFLWYILSALVGAVAIVASTYTRTGGLWDDLARGHPKKGELGHGVFETIGYDPTTNLSYPFRLANPTVAIY